jgi:hypothetical protein
VLFHVAGTLAKGRQFFLRVFQTKECSTMADDDSINSRLESAALNQELTRLQEGLPPTGAEPVPPIDDESSNNGDEFKDAQENETIATQL